MQDIEGELPQHLLPFWAQECWTWHMPEWWQRLWSRTGLVDVRIVDTLPDGWKLWLLWKKARHAMGDSSPEVESDICVLEADGGQYMGFMRMIGHRL